MIIRFIYLTELVFLFIGCTNQKNDQDILNKEIIDSIKSYYLLKYQHENADKIRVNTSTNDSTIEMELYLPPSSKENNRILIIALYLPKKINSNVFGSNGVLIGDLNADKIEEIIVPVQNESQYGGNLWWQDFFVFNKINGKIRLLSVNNDSEISGCQCKDCTYGIFRATEIKGGYLYGESNCYIENDPHCCPSTSYKTKVHLVNNKLIFLSKGDKKKVEY